MDSDAYLKHKFNKSIWNRFIKAIKIFDMIEEQDKIAVCCSGGKDSALLSICMRELQKRSRYHFELVFLNMNPGYDKETVEKIDKNYFALKINLNKFDSNIFEVVSKVGGAPCYLCARMRRGALYAKAKELGCTKIALGHHAFDVAETILLSMFYNGSFKTMKPILCSKNFENMKLIRPLYFVEEQDIINWTKYVNLQFIGCACLLQEKMESSRRLYIKNILKNLKNDNQKIIQNIITSAMNVNLETLISYFRSDL